MKVTGIGKVADAISIRKRPASAEDRAIPGHWEGDLIESSKNTYVATLAKRHYRYVMLIKVGDKKSDTIVKVLIKQTTKLPKVLYKSLT